MEPLEQLAQEREESRSRSRSASPAPPVAELVKTERWGNASGGMAWWGRILSADSLADRTACITGITVWKGCFDIVMFLPI